MSGARRLIVIRVGEADRVGVPGAVDANVPQLVEYAMPVAGVPSACVPVRMTNCTMCGSRGQSNCAVTPPLYLSPA